MKFLKQGFYLKHKKELELEEFEKLHFLSWKLKKERSESM